MKKTPTLYARLVFNIISSSLVLVPGQIKFLKGFIKLSL